MPEVGLLMAHVLFGVLGTLIAVALFFDVLHLSPSNIERIRQLSLAAVALFVLSYFVGGYWYVVHYAPEKALILAGPWPWAHNFFMEVKEHLFFVILLLALYLPVLVFDKQILEGEGLKKITLTVLGVMVVLGLTMDGFGAIIAMGSKVATLAKIAAPAMGG
ncbi:MAG TPA: hypothetical protein VMU10_02935 [Desulfomonilia bacterium]|nr:hypothetical protein [Desulfomonilia bacterium]